jgi:hypothetical protein
MAKRTIILKVLNVNTGAERFVRAQCEGVFEIKPGVVEIVGLSGIGAKKVYEGGDNSLVYLTNYKGKMPIAKIKETV